jgi:hypothetical protein
MRSLSCCKPPSAASAETTSPLALSRTTRLLVGGREERPSGGLYSAHRIPSSHEHRRTALSRSRYQTIHEMGLTLAEWSDSLNEVLCEGSADEVIRFLSATRSRVTSSRPSA